MRALRIGSLPQRSFASRNSLPPKGPPASGLAKPVPLLMLLGRQPKAAASARASENPHDYSIDVKTSENAPEALSDAIAASAESVG